MEPHVQIVIAWGKRTRLDVCDPPRLMLADELWQGFRNLIVRMYDDASIAWLRETFTCKYRWGRRREVDPRTIRARRNG